MDARKERIGEHAAEHPPAWAAPRSRCRCPMTRLTGSSGSAERRRSAPTASCTATSIPREPIGPEPTGDSPEKRAAWHSAFAALGPVDGVDLRGLPDGSLLHMRATYQTETDWAPRHVGRELQRIRISADDASLAVIRARAEERIALQRGQDEVAGRHGTLARSYAAMEAFYREHEIGARANDGGPARMGARHRGIAPPGRGRRRRIAPPSSRSAIRAAAFRRAGGDRRGPRAARPRRRAPSPTRRPSGSRGSPPSARLSGNALTSARACGSRARTRTIEDEGEAWPAWPEPDRDAILQPPKPEMRPAAGSCSNGWPRLSQSTA